MSTAPITEPHPPAPPSPVDFDVARDRWFSRRVSAIVTAMQRALDHRPTRDFRPFRVEVDRLGTCGPSILRCRSRRPQSATRRRSWAFTATTMVDRLIITAPTAGARVMPAHDSAPAARGIESTLYPAAQARFWRILR